VNPKAKLELHPDADSLNAFVEHALPEGERAGIVAHLADCARCREVVYLAQSAAVGELVAPAVATKAAQPEWLSSTFAKWRMAWIPAAALAAVAAVVLWVHLRPAPARQETAQMVMPPRAAAPPEAAPATAAPGPTTRPERAFAPAHAAPGARRASRQAAAPSAYADDEIERDKAAPDARKRAFGAVHLDGHSASLAAQAPPPVAFSPPVDTAFQQRANPQFQQQANQADGFSNSALTARPAPAPAPVPPNIVAVHGAALAPDTGGPQRLDAEAASKMVITPDASNGYAMMRLARRARLPSGLNAVSSAAIMNRLLAVDSAG